jgi:hypothetical protein
MKIDILYTLTPLIQLAVVAYRHLRALAEAAALLGAAAPASSTATALVAIQEQAATALRAFGEAQEAAEPNDIPELPGWGADDEPAPERVADRILAGEGTAEEIAAYAAGLDAWIHYGLPPEKRITLATHWAWDGGAASTPVLNLRDLQAMAPFQPAYFRMSEKTALALLNHAETVNFIKHIAGDVSVLERRTSRFRIAGLGDIEVGEAPAGVVLFLADNPHDRGVAAVNAGLKTPEERAEDAKRDAGGELDLIDIADAIRADRKDIAEALDAIRNHHMFGGQFDPIGYVDEVIPFIAKIRGAP